MRLSGAIKFVCKLMPFDLGFGTAMGPMSPAALQSLDKEIASSRVCSQWLR